VFFSIATAKRFIYSCCASFSVAVLSRMVMTLSWAAAPEDAAASTIAARPKRRAVRARVFVRAIGVLLQNKAMVHRTSDPRQCGARDARGDGVSQALARCIWSC